jgi:predicted ferric reductase
MAPRVRYAWAAVLIALTAALLGGAFLIPFKFESPSLFYKFGADKLLLRTGKVIGLAAAVLLLIQLPLAGRIKSLDRVFSLPVLYRVHRFNACLIALLVIAHPICVFVPDDMLMIPFETRYWPEWVGAALLVIILGQVVVSRWRHVISLPYHWWLRGHRMIGVIAAAALMVHVLYVSETFEQSGVPRIAVGMAAGCWVLIWLRIRVQSFLNRKRAYSVRRISEVGASAFSVDLVPNAFPSFSYAPGQFIFISFESPRLTREVHPFTLSSTPTRPQSLQITVRSDGDWTRHVGALQEGHRACIHGPFGHFTHIGEPVDRKIVMIAGGIGITPMLSMLRYMQDMSDQHPVTLIWSNRSEAFLFHRRELDQIQQQLPNFKWFPVFSREQGSFGRFGRLDRGILGSILTGAGSDATAFICGPPVMIRDVSATLRKMGFAPTSIKTELFGF